MEQQMNELFINLLLCDLVGITQVAISGHSLHHECRESKLKADGDSMENQSNCRILVEENIFRHPQLMTQGLSHSIYSAN